MSGHVVVRHPADVVCLECGWSYSWTVPVPIRMFTAGCMAAEREHQDCAIYRQDWRGRLLRTLLNRRPDDG